ncbi:centrosomal protein of 135 kDa-like [Entelurus aequoreus]|uniref:centrosomal protein of 135 kDa-like n=1 Tax=Entelurus aequoreus TaxID=161455 RepID=UPI002B1E86AB|nr:centrosomal protein of 135 kDa-like [Entelurus aequoreus]
MCIPSAKLWCVHRLQLEQTQQLLSDLQQTLSVKTKELRAAHVEMETLEETIGVLNHQVSQVQAGSRAPSALDKEKDALLDKVDQKTEKLVVLQEELAIKEKTLEDVRHTVTVMDKSLAQLQGALSSPVATCFTPLHPTLGIGRGDVWLRCSCRPLKPIP